MKTPYYLNCIEDPGIFQKVKVNLRYYVKKRGVMKTKLSPGRRIYISITPRKMSSSSSSVSGIMNSPASTSAKSAPKAVAKKTAAPVAAAPVAPAVAEAPKKAAKAEKAPKAEKAKAAAAPVVVSSTPVETAAPAAAAGPTTTLDEDLKAVTGNLNTLRETVSAMLGQVKRLEKRVHRELKDARKRKRRAPPAEGSAPKAPSIFERPTKVTDELCKFLGKPNATLMSRSEVTKGVNNYVKLHNLKDKHTIKPDAALKALLQIGDGEPLTYFNLQRYLNRHYVKAVPAVPSA